MAAWQVVPCTSAAVYPAVVLHHTGVRYISQHVQKSMPFTAQLSNLAIQSRAGRSDLSFIAAAEDVVSGNKRMNSGVLSWSQPVSHVSVPFYTAVVFEGDTYTTAALTRKPHAYV